MSMRKSLSADNLSLYSDLPPTPKGPGEMIVSPLVKSVSRRSSAMAKSAIPSPNFYGVREMMRTPKRPQASPRLAGVREMMASPKEGKTPCLTGVRDLLRTPKSQSSPQLAGVREVMKSPRLLVSPKLGGVRNLLRTPKSQSSPQLAGIQDLWMTPQVSSSPRVLASPVVLAQAKAPSPARRGRKRALSGAALMSSKKAKVTSVSPNIIPVDVPITRRGNPTVVVAVATTRRASTRGRRRATKSPSPAKPAKSMNRSNKVTAVLVEHIEETSTSVGLNFLIYVIKAKSKMFWC